MVSPFSDLEPFLAVVETGGFRAAADRMGLTPAAVSKAVARLEARLGARLFVRTTRRVNLTPEGEVFADRCRAAAREVAAGEGEISAKSRSMTGLVTVSAPFILGRYIMARLPAFMNHHSGLAVRVECTDRRIDVPAERADLAIRVGEPGEADLVVRRLGSLRWVLVAAPSYLARRGMPGSASDLARHRGLGFVTPSGRIAPWHLVDAGRTIEFAPPPGLSVDVGDFLLDAAMAGAGIAQIFSFMAADAIAEGRLVALLAPAQPPGPDLNAVMAPGRNANPRVRAFLDFLYPLFRDL